VSLPLVALLFVGCTLFGSIVATCLVCLVAKREEKKS